MKEINWEQLKTDYKNHKEVIENYEASAKSIELFKDLREHEAMKKIIKNFTDEIDYLNKVLINNRELSDEARREIFVKKDNAKFLVELFSGLEDEEKNIETAVDNLQAGK